MSVRAAMQGVAGMVLMASVVMADDATTCSAYISTVPYTIASPGTYCFNTNLTTSLASGNAIDIDANNVILDMKGFKLRNTADESTTLAKGIYSTRRGLTIRNCRIQGFAYGLVFNGDGEYVVEGNRFESNRFAAINIPLTHGRGSVIVRDNVVSDVGVPAQGQAFGIWVSEGATLVKDNVVHNVKGTAIAVGIATCISGDSNEPGVPALIEGNQISGLSAPTTVGVEDQCGIAYCRGNTVLGIGPTGAVTTPYLSCTAIGPPGSNYP
jgi:hypothetical protein